MFQFSPLNFTKKLSGSRHKSTDVDDYFNEAQQTNFMSHTPYSSKALRIKHRKNKTGIQGQQLEISPLKTKIVNEAKIQEYGLPFTEALQDNFSSKIARKSTMSNISQGDLIDANKEGFNQFILGRKRSKKSWKKELNNTQEMLNNNVLIRFHNRLESKKKFQETLKVVTKIKKKSSQQSNETSQEIPTNSSQTELVNLISKFKFENLKTLQELPESLEVKKACRKIQSHKSQFLAPFAEELQIKRKAKGRQRMNKTMIKIGNTPQSFPFKLVNQKLPLTPWQFDPLQPVSPIDIF